MEPSSASTPRLLVTGASGLLGAMLVHRARASWRVLAAVHRTSLTPDGFQTATTDFRQADAASRLVEGFKPDWICHCAALTNVDLCENDPALARALNVSATESLASAAAKHGARLLLISTDSVFDGARGGYGEDDRPSPLNVYARTKREAEERALSLLPSTLVARTNFYGWNLQSKKSLAEWVLGELKKDVSVPGWTDVFFTPLFNEDLADILLAMMKKGLGGLYHVGGSERCSKYEFARAVAREWGFDPARVQASAMGAARLTAPRPRDTSLRCGKLAAALGRALPDLSAGLGRMRGWSDADLTAFKRLLN